MKKNAFEQAWRKKYGMDPKMTESRIAEFLQHRSVRQFSKRQVSEKRVQALFAAAQSASSSANLQLWSAVSVQATQARATITKACGDQSQIKTCAWFFVFLADHYRIHAAAKKMGVRPSALDLTELYTMAVVDASIAAERMACAAEALDLGVCYIGAIRNNPPKIKSILKLPNKTFALFGLCIGVPAHKAVGDIKPRLRQESVWSREVYNRAPDISEYDARIRNYYANERGIETDWSTLSSKRVSGANEGGRAKQKKWLKSQGFKLD